MNPLGELVIGGLMAVGLLGVLVPVLPGLLLIGALAVVWAFEVATPTAWLVTTVMVVVLGIGTWLKYQVPGRELAAGKPSTRTWVLGAIGGLVGFFVVPVVGLVLGLVVGIFVGHRLDGGSTAEARRATMRFLRGVGTGIAIEFGAGLAAVSLYAFAAGTMGP